MRTINAGTLALTVVIGLSFAGLGARAAAPPSGAVPPPLEPLRVAMREPGEFGGRFVIAVTSDPRTLNPIMAAENNSSDVCDRLFTALAEFDNATQQYEPELARAWDLSADGRTCTWHLRRGARFSDGHPITSDDVRFSFDVAYDTTLHPPIQDALQVHGENIAVTAPDSYTVVTRISGRYALLVPTVASLRILPRHVLEAPWRQGRFASSYGTNTPPESLVTSGAWTLAQCVPHEKVVLGRNPYWFEVDARGRRLPYLNELIFLVVPDQNTATLKFQARDGELDGLDNLKPEDFATLQANQARDGYTLHDLGASLTSNFFWFNLNTVKGQGGAQPQGSPCVGPVKYGWFSDRTFRRAVSMAIDREAMIHSVFFGDGVKSWSVITPGNRVFYNPRAPAYDHDPEGARRLLKGLGFADRDGDGVLEDPKGNPVSFVLKTNANSGTRVQLANFVRDDLAKIGIRCTLMPVDFNTMIGNIQDNFDYDAILGGLGSTVPPDPGLGANFYCSSGATHFWNARQERPQTRAEARLDSLFDEIVATPDPAARKAISAEMERVIGEECWVIWLPVPKVKVAVRDRFGNVEASSIRHRLLWNIQTVFAKAPAQK